MSHFADTRFFRLEDEECRRVIDQYFPDTDWKGVDVLDAGCRFAEFSNAFDRLGAKVSGVDLEHGCIEEAKRSFPDLSERFHQGDIRDLAMFDDNSFDIVFCVGVLPYLDVNQQRRALQEFHRVCRPGGQILIVLQRYRTIMHRTLSRIINLLPASLHHLLIVRILTPFLYPLSAKLLGRKMERERFEYIFGYGLRNLHFGYPRELLPFEVETPHEALIDPETSISFLIPAKDAV